MPISDQSRGLPTGTDGGVAGHRCRALIVEDDAAIRRLVAKILSRSDIDVDVAGDGRMAVDLLATNSYDVIVLDLMMPGMNGFEVLEQIRRSGIRSAVAVVSAVSNQALRDLDRDLVKLVISKPFDVQEFTQAVVRLCRHEPAVP